MNELEIKTDNKYKDTVFRMLFNDENNLLSLYNAVNETHHENPDDLQITTLKDACFMNYKNDVSCILDFTLSLYEHQSTVNPNMPLRDLFYVAEQLRLLVPPENLYRTKQMQIPIPRFVVFYNGTTPQPERVEYRLSDCFEKETEDPQLELKVLQYNINDGFNQDLLEACRTLKEYMQFVNKVRQALAETGDINSAVPIAVERCIEEGILAGFLKKYKSEVIRMSIFEYDQEAVLKVRAKDAFEDGRAAGRDEERKNTEAANARAEAANARAEEERKNREAADARAEEERKNREAADARAEEAEKQLVEALAMIERLKSGE